VIGRRSARRPAVRISNDAGALGKGGAGAFFLGRRRMRNIHFTADTHFGHMFALTKRRRPFDSLGAMDECLVARWNERVGAADEVYHLGDVAHPEHAALADVLGRLNGRLHLVLGNNDVRDAMEATGRFASICEMREMTIGCQRIFLCHYPLRDWPNAWRGAWHLYGHVHGKFDRDPLGLSLDVGVDSHGLAPIALDKVAGEIRRRVPGAAAQALNA
jgi:calcineurin-like phosphoesterase family protein